MDYIEESEETLNTEEEPTSENGNFDEEQETADELRERLRKAEEIAENQRIRAEKAERKFKPAPAKEQEKTKESSYTLQDIRALADVHDEDVERVEKFARLEGISIAEAKKHEDLQAILKHRAELRKTAEASNTGVSKRGSSKVSSDKLLEDFEKGLVSENDDDIQKLVEAQMARKKAVTRRS